MKPEYLTTLELDKIISKAAGYCVCSQAAALAAQLCPSVEIEEVRFALEQTDAVTSLLLKNGSPRYGGVAEADKIVAHAVKGGILSMGELLEIARVLRNFSGLVQWYGLTEHGELPTDECFYSLSPQPQLEQLITDSIISPEEMSDHASPTLADLRRKIRQTESSIRDRLDRILKSVDTSKFLQDAVVSLRNGRYVVPVKAEYRGEISGVIHDVSSTGATLFVEPTAVVEANARIMQLRAKEQEEITRILSALSAQVAALEPAFTVSYQAMLQIDLLMAKARLALDMNAAKPQLNYGRAFSLKKARHPLIAKDKVVPVDITLGADYDTMVITGPNTGGKTVTLKTAGLLCAMAQCGFLIPAREQSSVCIFAQYLVDIGDEQSIEQSLSTFSGHMKKIADILDNADGESLVLLDELGAGTDPAEGAALAVSIIEQLRRRRSLIIATTHYAEMKVFALETPGVTNASCEFDLESLRPTYRLSIGAPGRSNAFLISEKLGIPPEVIDAARVHLSAEDKRLDAVLGRLDDLKLELKNSQDEVERLRYEAENALESAREQREKMIAQGQLELEAAREKARRLAGQVEAEAYALTEELRKLQKDEKQSAAQRAARAREIARKDSERLLDKAASDASEQHFVPLTEVRVGQEVLIASLQQLATVRSLPDNKGMVEVQAGIIKTKVPLDGLCAPKKMETPEKTRKRREPQPRSGKAVQLDHERRPGMELDIRGYDSETGVLEAERFIDHALLSGQTMVTIIHGKGTGVLRSAIQAALRRNRHVKSFRLGRYGEGETGVTVVELK